MFPIYATWYSSLVSCTRHSYPAPSTQLPALGIWQQAFGTDRFLICIGCRALGIQWGNSKVRRPFKAPYFSFAMSAGFRECDGSNFQSPVPITSTLIITFQLSRTSEIFSGWFPKSGIHLKRPNYAPVKLFCPYPPPPGVAPGSDENCVW